MADDGDASNDVHMQEDGTYANAYGGVFIPPSQDMELMYGSTV